MRISDWSSDVCSSDLLDVPTALFNPVAIIRDVSWQETIGLLTGHLIYGGVLGALYTHPVGYPAAHPIKPKVAVRPFILAGRPPTPAPKRQRLDRKSTRLNSSH